MIIRKPYTQLRVTTDPVGVSRTKQSQLKECDINLIMKKYQKTGIINHFNKHGAMYGEYAPLDLISAYETLERTNEMFLDLPAKVRARFKNQPEAFLEFVQDPKNKEEMYELGLARRPAPVEPEPPVVPPQPPVQP